MQHDLKIFERAVNGAVKVPLKQKSIRRISLTKL